MRRIFALVGCAFVSSACGISFPEEYHVEDLRVLEVRVEPPEIALLAGAEADGSRDALAGATPDLREVRFSALVAHPDLDATFGYEWIRCKRRALPGAPETGFRRVPCDAELQSRIGSPEQTTTLSPVGLLLEDFQGLSESDLESAVGSLVSDPRDLLAGLYAHINLRASVTAASVDADTRVLEATKRLVIFDPAVVALTISEARSLGPGALPRIEGIETPTLCTNLREAALGPVFEFLRTRTPNRSPVYTRLEYLGPTDTSSRSHAGETIEVAPGDRVVFRGRVPPEAFETYRLLDDNCKLETLTETLAWSWFANAGALSVHITSESKDPARNRTLRTTFTAPVDFEGAELRVRIWSVLRDGRGGSDSRTVDLRVRR